MEDFFLDIVYKDKKVRFRIMNPQAPLSTLMNNLRHAIGKDGRLIFDFPSIDPTGAFRLFLRERGHRDSRNTRSQTQDWKNRPDVGRLQRQQWRYRFSNP